LIDTIYMIHVIQLHGISVAIRDAQNKCWP